MLKARAVFGSFVLVVLVGCASSPQVNPPEGVSAGFPEGTEAPAVDEGGVSQPTARSKDEMPPENDAVMYLLDRAEGAEKKQEYSLAQALAERALRIQRTAARAYLVLARVQQAFGDAQKASDFASQGLLYVPESSDLGRSLAAFL